MERNAVPLNGKRIVIGFPLFQKLLLHFIKGFLIFFGFFCDILVQRSILKVGKHRLKISGKIRKRAVFYFAFHNFPMVVVMLVLHPFNDFFVDGGDTINQTQGVRPLIAHRVQNIVHPYIILASGVDEQIAVLNRLNILRGRLIGMAFRAGLQQHRNVCLVAYNLAGKIILGENRSYNRQLLRIIGICRFIGSAAGGQAGENQYRRQQN